jgi:E3 ubiquitin-protein ligase RNF14
LYGLAKFLEYIDSSTFLNILLIMNEEQKEEILALQSIFGEDVILFDDAENTGQLKIRLELGQDINVEVESDVAGAAVSVTSPTTTAPVRYLPDMTVCFEYNADYPRKRPPTFKLKCDWLFADKESVVRRHLLAIWEENAAGNVVLYQWHQALVHEMMDIIGATEIGTLYVESPAILKALMSHSETILSKAFAETTHTCTICFMELQGSDFEVLVPCRHSFCKECIAHHCTARLTDGQMDGLLCPEPECRAQIHPNVVQNLTDTKLFERYDRHLLNFAIRSMSSTSWCPRLSCQHPAQVKEEISLGECPACCFAFCTKCLLTYHGLSECAKSEEEKEKEKDSEQKQKSADLQEFEAIMMAQGSKMGQKLLNSNISYMFSSLDAQETNQLKQRYKDCEETKKRWDDLYGAPTMTYYFSNRSTYAFSQFIDSLTADESAQKSRSLGLMVVATNVKRCPKCYCPIEKDGGCHHMMCTFCQTHFCWNCLQEMAECTNTQCRGRNR